VRLHLQVQVRQRRIARVSCQRERIALPDALSFADSQRPLPEVREYDEMAALEFDDDDASCWGRRSRSRSPRSSPLCRRPFRSNQTRLTTAHPRPISSTAASAWWL